MSGLLAGAAIGGGINLTKGIFGAIQASKGTKAMNKLLANRPQYEISKGYLDAYNTYKQLASSQLPGYDQQLGQIGQSQAKTMDYAREGAMGSNQFLNAALQSQDKELEAIRNLGIMSSQWRAQQQQQLAGAQNNMGDLQTQQWQQNVNEPWNMKMNMANEQRQSGFANMFGGMEGLGSTLSNYFGTKSYLDVLRGLQPKP
jgi:hypothetical protein